MIPQVIAAVTTIIDKIVPDKAEATRLKTALLEMDHAELQAASAVIVAEAQSEHRLTSAWRPITMLAFVAIIVNNYIVAPYSGALFGVSVSLPIPPEMWNLLTVGIGGYVGLRSVEKSVKHWRSTS